MLDTLNDSANLANSGDAAELAATRDLTNIQTLNLDSKIDIGGSNTPALNPGFTDQYVIDVGTSTPGYFLLKFGTGNIGRTIPTSSRTSANSTSWYFPRLRSTALPATATSVA